MSVRIFSANLPIAPMDYEFRPLITRNLTSDVESFSLRGGTYCRARITRTFYLPTTIGMRRNMLIFSHLQNLLTHDAGTGDYLYQNYWVLI